MTNPFTPPSDLEPTGGRPPRASGSILKSVKAGAAYFCAAAVIGWLIWATSNAIHNQWHPVAIIAGVVFIPVSALVGAAIGGLLGLVVGLSRRLLRTG